MEQLSKARDWYQVNEIFTSVQGEGVHVGKLATFIRLQGCTVGCPWCDSGPLADEVKGRTNGETHNTWGRGGKRMTVEEILNQVEARHVIITGGEPTLWDLDGLLRPLSGEYYTQLETSGQNKLKGIMRPNWITWSPKSMLQWRAPVEIRVMADEVKWVIEPVLDFERILAEWEWQVRIRSVHNLPEFVLMPEGCPPSSENVALATKMLEQIQEVTYDTDRPWLEGRPADHWRFGDRLQYRLGVR